MDNKPQFTWRKSIFTMEDIYSSLLCHVYIHTPRRAQTFFIAWEIISAVKNGGIIMNNDKKFIMFRTNVTCYIHTLLAMKIQILWGGNYNWNEAQWKVNSKHNLYIRLESFNI